MNVQITIPLERNRLKHLEFFMKEFFYILNVNKIPTGEIVIKENEDDTDSTNCGN